MSGPRKFITTCWERFAVTRSQSERDTALRADNGRVATVYHHYGKAVHSYIEINRSRYGIPRFLTTSDLTQEFFEVQLRRNALADLDPAKGSFRAWLKQCLRNFLRDVHDRECAAARGKGRDHEPLYFADGKLRPVANHESPADEQTDRSEAMRCAQLVSPEWQADFDSLDVTAGPTALARRRQQRSRALKLLVERVRLLMYKRRLP